jgi:HEPN domain-containing protein
MPDPKTIEIQSWLARAQQDLDSATWLLKSPNPLYNSVGFHCQQAAEKVLKAFLTWKEVPFEKTHSLVAIIGVCLVFDDRFNDLRPAAVSLTPYAVSTRYPGDLPELTQEEAGEAVRYASQIYTFVVYLLPTKNPSVPLEPIIEPFRQFALFSSLVKDEAALKREYAAFLEHLFLTGFWPSTDFPYPRIPWKLFGKAINSLPESYKNPGLYLFGSESTPRYLGSTTTTLLKRIRGRYIGGEKTQCRLAETYRASLIAHGLKGFPEEITSKVSFVRRKGAVDFANYIESLWVVMIPAKKPVTEESVRSVEYKLIKIAKAWNSEKGYPPLLNK